MAKYTIEVYSLLKNKNFKLFDFGYDFYIDNENIRKEFEEKFIDRYLFHELGFETVIRFKHYLRERLNSIAPYYKQLYFTEIESKKCNFMLNKDLVETFERDIANNGLNKVNSNNTNNSKESYLENGNANINLSDGYLTGVSETTDNSMSNLEQNNTMKEGTKLTSQGNIGITSSAELLRDWRSVLINIQDLIIRDCEDLFMQIY